MELIKADVENIIREMFSKPIVPKGRRIKIYTIIGKKRVVQILKNESFKRRLKKLGSNHDIHNIL